MPSDVPHSSPRRRRETPSASKKIAAVGVGLAALGVLSIFSLQSALESYLKGEAFRNKTQTAIGHALHSEATLAPLDRQGTEILSNSLKLAGRGGAFFKTAELQAVRAEVDLNALWRRLWKIDVLRCQRLDLNLDSPDTTAPETDPAPATPAPTAWWTGLLPRKTQLREFRTDRASVAYGAASLRNTRLLAKPSEGGWEILLESGELKWPNLPPAELTESKIVVHSGADATGRARVLLKSGGQLALTGGWTKESGFDLHTQLENVDVQPFLPVWFQSRIHGALQGKVRFVKTATAKNGELSGDLSLTGASLEAIPLFSALDAFIGNPRFHQIPLKNASAHFSQTSERIELTDLDLDGAGLLRIKGSLTIKSRSLQGQFKLGISPSLIQWLPEGRTKIFAEARDGYVWTPFELSGTTDLPRENLSERLATSVVDAAKETLRTLPDNLPIPKNLPQNIPEAAKGLLDAVKSFIPGK